MIDKKNILYILVILFFALMIRALYFYDLKNSVVYPVLAHSDSDAYRSWARDISSGYFLGNKAFMKWPFYAYFLGFLFGIFGQNILLVFILQFILGVANCVLVYLIAKKIFDQRVGFIAALFCAGYGVFTFYDALLVYTSLSLFLNLLFFLLILKIKDFPTGKKLFWLGMLLGICTITQANVIIFGIIAAVLSFGIKKLVPFMLGLLLIIASVTLRNYLVEKDFILITGNLGFNFYSGNNPKASGTFYCPDDVTLNQEDMFRDAKIIACQETAEVLKPSQVSAFWFSKAKNFIIQNPLKAWELFIRKLSYVFSPREYIHDIEYNYLVDKIGIFKIIPMNLKLFLAFICLGIIMGLKKIKKAILLYLALVTFALSIAIFFITSRYRIMLVPYLMIFAGYGLVNLWDTIKEKRYFKLGVIALFLAVVFILSNRALTTRNNFSEFEYYFNRGLREEVNSRYQNAIREFSVARTIDPVNRRVLFRLGVSYHLLGDLKSAEAIFKEVIKISPLSVDAYYNLGFIYNQQKRFAEAKKMLEEAILLDPEYIKAHYELAYAYKSLGDKEAAQKEFTLALNKISRWRKIDRQMIEKELNDLKR